MILCDICYNWVAGDKCTDLLTSWYVQIEGNDINGLLAVSACGRRE